MHLIDVFKRHKFSICDDTIDFEYAVNPIGLAHYLNDWQSVGLPIGLDDLNIFIDNEQNTVSAFQRLFQNTNVKILSVDSRQCFGVRMADLLAGFISRMLRSISCVLNGYVVDLNEPVSEELIVLSVEWFDLRYKPAIFELYRLIASVMIGDDLPYWTVFGDIFGDEIVVLFSLLRYFLAFEDFSEYCSIDANEHVLRFHRQSMLELHNRFDDMGRPTIL